MLKKVLFSFIFLFIFTSSAVAVTRAGTSIESSATLSFSGHTVTSEAVYTTVSQVYGLTVSPTYETANIPGGELFYFSRTLLNIGNGTTRISLEASATPEGWAAYLVRDDNRDEVHQDSEMTVVPKSILLAEDADYKFFLTLDAPDSAVIGSLGYGTAICSTEFSDGFEYVGGNGILYGGEDTVLATCSLSIESLGNARIWRNDSIGKAYITWGGGPADIYQRTSFGITFEGGAASLEASYVSSPHTCEGISTKDGNNRYYRVALTGTTSFTANILGKFDIPVAVGLNEISLPLVPFDASIASVIGRQVTGANNSYDADRIWKYNPLVQSNYDIAWLVGGVGPPYDGQWYTGNYPTTLSIEADEGFILQIREGHSATYITIVGRVSEVDRYKNISVGMNFVGTCFPIEVPLGDQASFGDSNLWESGATGSNNSYNADRVWSYNPAVQSGYDIAWLVGNVNPTYNGIWYTGNYPTIIKLKPGKAYWVQVKTGHLPFTWHYPKPY